MKIVALLGTVLTAITLQPARVLADSAAGIQGTKITRYTPSG